MKSPRCTPGTFPLITLGVMGLLSPHLSACSKPSNQPGATLPASSDIAPGADTLDAIYATSQAQLTKLLNANQPASGTDALPLIAQAGEMVRTLTSRELDAGKTPVDFDAISSAVAPVEAREAARRAVAELESKGVGHLMSQIALAPRAVPEVKPELLLNMLLPQLGQIRSLTRLTSARATIALEKTDHAAFLARIDEMIALSKHAANQPGALGGLVGAAVRARALESVRRAVLSGTLNDITLASLDTRLRAAPTLTAAHLFATEQVMTENVIEFVYFAGPEGMLAIQNLGTGNNPTPKPTKRFIQDGVALGTGMPDRATQLTLSKAYYEHMRQLGTLNPAQRADAATPARLLDDVKNNLLLGILTPSLSRVFTVLDQIAADDQGTLALIALERYRIAHNSYPESLAALVPAFLSSGLIDPYNGKPLGYLPPKAGGYADGRGFVLYVAGPDAIDNGGNVDFKEPFQSQGDKGAGKDFLLNRETK